MSASFRSRLVLLGPHVDDGAGTCPGLGPTVGRNRAHVGCDVSEEAQAPLVVPYGHVDARPPSLSSLTMVPPYSSAIQRAGRSTPSLHVGASSRTRRGACRRVHSPHPRLIAKVRGARAVSHQPRSSRPSPRPPTTTGRRRDARPGLAGHINEGHALTAPGHHAAPPRSLTRPTRATRQSCPSRQASPAHPARETTRAA